MPTLLHVEGSSRRRNKTSKHNKKKEDESCEDSQISLRKRYLYFLVFMSLSISNSIWIFNVTGTSRGVSSRTYTHTQNNRIASCIKNSIKMMRIDGGERYSTQPSGYIFYYMLSIINVHLCTRCRWSVRFHLSTVRWVVWANRTLRASKPSSGRVAL